MKKSLNKKKKEAIIQACDEKNYIHKFKKKLSI